MNQPTKRKGFRSILWHGAVVAGLVVALPAQAEWVEWVGDAAVDAKYRHNINFSDFDNVTEEDWVLEARGTYGRFYQVAESSRIGLIGRLSALKHENWDELDGVLAGAELVGIHKFGLGPTAPVVRISYMAENMDIKDAMRDGQHQDAAINLSKRFTERFDASVGYSYYNRDGHAGATSIIALGDTDVFDQEQDIWSIRANYLLTERMLGSIGYSYVDGEFATQCPDAGIGLTALLNPEIKGAAVDTVFGGTCTYKAEGEVDAVDVGLSYFIDQTTSLELGYQLRSGEAGNLDYTSYDVSLGVSLLF